MKEAQTEILTPDLQENLSQKGQYKHQNIPKAVFTWMGEMMNGIKKSVSHCEMQL